MTKILAPQRGPQTEFLSAKADVVIYGGQAGGGKSFGLLLEPLRNINVPGFGAVIFRRTRPQVRNKGGLWDTSKEIYNLIPGAVPASSVLKWTFGDGTVDVKFDHLEYEMTVLEWDGAQIPLLGFDQLEHFSREQFRYMLTRNRSACGIRPYCRATCNPRTDSWILELIGWYIDEAGDPIYNRSGVVRYFYTHQDKFVTAYSIAELRRIYKIPADLVPDELIKSVTFIPARLQDNPALTDKDPAYMANLLLQSEAERARLLGNWKARKQGKMFKRDWFQEVPADPARIYERVVVGVDPSGSVTGDAQGIIAVAKGRDGRFYVLEDATCSLSPAGWARVTIETYHAHKADKIVAETNYGGDMVVSNIQAVDRYANVGKVSASRSKAIRAEPIASLYEKGLISHVGAKPELEDELAGFDPDDKKAPSPNRMDALVWAVTELMGEADGVLDYYRMMAAEEKNG